MVINELYLDHLAYIMDPRKSMSVTARGKDTNEVIGKSFSWPMSSPVITIPERKLNYRFMMGEAAWILSGSNEVEYITRYMKSYANYSDDGQTLSGAYGPPIIDQLSYIVKTLNEDPGSRQAVLTIWRPRPGPSRDIPCTCSMQFFIRDGELCLVVYMRSSDAWLGIPYDVFSFSMVAFTVACLLEHPVSLGAGHVLMGSSHVYRSNFEDVERLLACDLPDDGGILLDPVFTAKRFREMGGSVTRKRIVRELEFLADEIVGKDMPSLCRWINRELGNDQPVSSKGGW